MTLLQSTNQVIGALLEKDIFTQADFASIKVDDAMLDRRDDLVRASLATLVEAGMIRPIGTDAWILVAPLNSNGQEVHISMGTCLNIAETLNLYLEAEGIEERVNAMEIHEGHIMHLIEIVAEYLSEE